VAVNETHERPPDAIAHRAAETASVKHLISHDQAPFLIGIDQRYIDRLDPVKKSGRSLFATIRGETGLVGSLVRAAVIASPQTLLNPQAQFTIDHRTVLMMLGEHDLA
jgi:hypothetical protein